MNFTVWFVLYCMEMYWIESLYMYCALLIESLYCMQMYIIHGLSRYICNVLYCIYVAT